jgi:hypothetical protein
MSILRNAILVLEKAKVPIFKETITKVLDSQQGFEVEPKDMLQNVESLSQTARDMIE